MAGSWLYDSLENQDATVGTLRRALILKVDDSGPQQLVDLQGLASDLPRKLVRILPHGFSSNPPLQSEGVLKSLGGRSDRGMFIGGEHPKYRQKNLQPGNAILYDDKGNVVWMQSGQGIARTTKAGPIVDTSAASITLDAATSITLDAKGDVLTVMTEGFNIIVNPKGAKVFLGGDPNTDVFALVMTVAGPAANVYAKIA